MNFLTDDKTINQITGLEHKLASALKPIQPDPEYVNRLKHSLGNTPYTVLERKTAVDPALIVLLGVAAGITAVYFLRKLRN